MFVWLIENRKYIFIVFFLTVNDRCDIVKKQVVCFYRTQDEYK